MIKADKTSFKCKHLRNAIVTSRRRKNENVFKMSKDQKCTCKACKNTVFHCQIFKFVGFLLLSSSWLLKLPFSMLITLYKICEVHFRLLGTHAFHVKTESDWFSVTSSRCHQNLKYENFTSPFGRLRQNIVAKKRAARVARLVFFIQPIKSLICGLVADVAVVKS